MGSGLPSRLAWREMPERFPEAERIVEAKTEADAQGHAAFIAESTRWPERLAAVLRAGARAAASVGVKMRTATVYAEATIVESRKRTTHGRTGGQGNEPVVAAWAEIDGVLATEFLDGNAPAHIGAVAVRAGGLRGIAAGDGGVSAPKGQYMF